MNFCHQLIWIIKLLACFYSLDSYCKFVCVQIVYKNNHIAQLNKLQGTTTTNNNNNDNL